MKPALLELTHDDAEIFGFPAPVCLLHAAPPAPLEHMVAGLMLANSIVGITGEDESYKTTLVLALGVAVAGGFPFLGAFQTGCPRSVLVVSEEDDRDVIQNRVEAIIRGMGWESRRPTILMNLHVHALDGLLLDDLVSQAHLLRLQDTLAVELMIFDPLADLVQGNEDTAKGAQPVKRLWRRLIAQGCAVVVVMHYGKPAEGKSDRDRMRGSSAWRSAMRAVYGLKRVDDGIEVECLKMSRTRRPDPFRVDVEVLTEEGNDAMWLEARLTVAGRSGDWRVKNRRALTPSDRKALGALDDFREEVLSWTRWVEVSGLSTSTLAAVRRRLIDLKYVEPVNVGVDRFKKPQHRYSITGEGISALISPPDSETPGETPGEAPDGVSIPDYETPAPPLGGAVSGSPVEGDSETPDSRLVGDAWEEPAA